MGLKSFYYKDIFIVSLYDQYIYSPLFKNILLVNIACVLD